MNEQKTVTLDDAVSAARDLPDAVQEALAREMLDRIADFQTPDRPPARQQIIQERLARPLSAISRDDLMKMLREYDPDL